jgi:hypothetical protein
MWPDLFHVTSFNTLASALNVLTAMITPALLLSATGTYILATTSRLGRVVDRMRLVSEKVEALSLNEQAAMRIERIEDYRAQMRRLRVRLGLLQNAVISLYSAALTFILCSVAIGVTAAISLKLYWLPCCWPPRLRSSARRATRLAISKWKASFCGNSFAITPSCSSSRLRTRSASPTESAADFQRCS